MTETHTTPHFFTHQVFNDKESGFVVRAEVEYVGKIAVDFRCFYAIGKNGYGDIDQSKDKDYQELILDKINSEELIAEKK